MNTRKLGALLLEGALAVVLTANVTRRAYWRGYGDAINDTAFALRAGLIRG